MVQLLAHWTSTVNIDWLWSFLNHTNALLRFDPAFLTALPGIIWALLAWKVSTLVLTNRRVGTVVIRLVQTIGKLKIKDIEAEWPQQMAAQMREIANQQKPQLPHLLAEGSPLKSTQPPENITLPEKGELPVLKDDQQDISAQSPETGTGNLQTLGLTVEQERHLSKEIQRINQTLNEITNEINSKLAVYEVKNQVAGDAAVFLKIYAYLSAEQLSILKTLNAGPFPRRVIVQLHKNSAPLKDFGQGSKAKDEVWIDYLISSNLIEDQAGEISLTSYGREFLKFLVDQQLPLNKTM